MWWGDLFIIVYCSSGSNLSGSYTNDLLDPYDMLVVFWRETAFTLTASLRNIYMYK